MWLGDTRGELVDWTTQQWVRATGRRLSLAEHSWLEGPAGKPTGIGSGFFEAYAAERGLQPISRGIAGLLPGLEGLRGSGFDPDLISPAVLDFYVHTAAYDLDVWSEWSGAFRPFGRALSQLFSRRLQQLNMPLSNMDTSLGMSSQVVSIIDPATGLRVFAAWVRQLLATKRVIYAGAYSTCVVPDGGIPCVRVVFPLPNGNAVVLMRPSARSDGSLLLESAGAGFGGPGFYFTVGAGDGAVRARYLRSLRESIHVYASGGTVRADHVLSLWRLTFLRLHYRAVKRTQT